MYLDKLIENDYNLEKLLIIEDSLSKDFKE